MTQSNPQSRQWRISDIVLAGALSVLSVTFLAWAGVVYTGVKAVNGQLEDWRAATRLELTTIKVDLATVKSNVQAIRAWQLTHGARAHTEAIERLGNHEARLLGIEREQQKLRERHLNDLPGQ